jgi:hypothetical protein
VAAAHHASRSSVELPMFAVGAMAVGIIAVQSVGPEFRRRKSPGAARTEHDPNRDHEAGHPYDEMSHARHSSDGR